MVSSEMNEPDEQCSIHRFAESLEVNFLKFLGLGLEIGIVMQAVQTTLDRTCVRTHDLSQQSCICSRLISFLVIVSLPLWSLRVSERGDAKT